MNERQIVIYFTNGRMVTLPENKIRYVRLGSGVDQEYTPDTGGGVAVVNWNNVCFVREWIKPDDFDL